MKNWTIGKRISFGFAAVLLVMLMLGVFTLLRLNVIQAEVADVTHTNLPCLESLADAQLGATETRALVYKHVFSPSDADKSALEDKIAGNTEKITKAFAVFEKLTGPEGKSLFEQVKICRGNYVSKRSQMLALSHAATNAEDSAKLIVKVREELDPLAEAYSAAMTKCQESEQKNANASGEIALSAVHSTNVGTAIGLGIAFILGGGLAFLITRGTKRVLQSLTSTLTDGSSQIASAAGQMSSTSRIVAEAASEQAASLEETSASLEEISSMTKRNAENSVNGKNLSQQTADSANSGLDKLAEMGRTISSIKGAVADMESAVCEMQGSSQEIAKIIKTIDEIAFQTNLLALNAAVEAARAGEAGMGFAVVADEVRALAQRSAQAARDTSDKIEHAIKRSELGGVASAKVVKNLTEVEGNARNIEAVFNGIVTQIKSLDAVINEIAAACQEQSRGVAEVNLAVNQMDKVTQGNAASAEENASAAEQLNSQVVTLQQIVTGLEVVVNGQAGNITSASPASQKTSATSAPAKHKSAPAGRLPALKANNNSGNLSIPMPEQPRTGSSAHSFTDF